jgi:protein-S-isoprenylcysteine O-methyltransferase Ste14
MKGPSFPDATSRPATFPLRLLTVAYGGMAYLLFVATFVYAIGFVGNLLVPKSIDTGLPTSPATAAAVDLVLLSSFAVPHSVMARPRFKHWWTRFIPLPIERSTYVLVSSLLLALLFWQWLPLPGTVWQVEQPAAVATLWGFFVSGWLIALISTFLLDHFELFGLRQVYLYATGTPYSSSPFRTPALYRVVRHPIMLGFLLAFWATPTMTWSHLLFAGTTTVYIVLGIHLEERDLRSVFGRRYEEYQEQVSMLLPWSRGRRSNAK